MPKKKDYMGNGWGELSDKHKQMRCDAVALQNMLELLPAVLGEELKRLGVETSDENLDLIEEINKVQVQGRKVIGFPWQDNEKPGGLHYHKDTDEISYVVANN
tara:strand:+ start:470 stop:778 length:309 start_codon:yes stop_codon:yes gene_type:complete